MAPNMIKFNNNDNQKVNLNVSFVQFTLYQTENLHSDCLLPFDFPSFYHNPIIIMLHEVTLL